MPETTMRLPGSVAEVRASPEGPEIGAFFDVDGTLVAGYTANVHAKDRMRRREGGLLEIARSLGLAINYQMGRTTFEELLAGGVRDLRGRRVDELDELGDRLFQQDISDLMYPEMRELVRAHQERGHTVALSTSAMPHQIEPIARYLGIDHVLSNRWIVDGDGVLTGEIVEPIIWGPGKSAAVQRFATDNDIDLGRSFFYADGDEDLPLMYAIGHPRPTNPGERMSRIAAQRGWPVLRFTSRGKGSRLRSLAGVAAAFPLAGAAVGIGLLSRDRRAGVNVLTSRWPSTLLAINGVKVNVIGQENLTAARPAVFIFNHRNNFDAFIAAALVKDDWTGIAKKELENTPVLGQIAKLMDVAFVDRTDSRAALAALKPVEETLAKGISVLISPEGTRLDTTTVGPFKKGAFRIAMAAGVPLVPIVIRNAQAIAGRNASVMNPGTVDVAVLEPIPVDDWTVRDLGQRIEEVRQLFIDTLDQWPATGGE